MRTILIVATVFVLSFLLSIVQFFITGIYGKIMFFPIFLLMLTFVLCYEDNFNIMKKYSKK